MAGRRREVEILPPLTEEDKMLSGLAYPAWFVVPAFVLLSPKREDPFLHFHALQGLLFGISASLSSLIGLLAIYILFQIMPGAGGTLSGLVGVTVFCSGLLAGVVLFMVAVFLGWRAASGQFLRLPVLGEWCELRMATSLELDYEGLRMAEPPQAAPPVIPSAAPWDEPGSPAPAAAEPVPTWPPRAAQGGRSAPPSSPPAPAAPQTWSPQPQPPSWQAQPKPGPSAPPASRPTGSQPKPWAPTRISGEPGRGAGDASSVMRKWLSGEE